MIRRLLSTITSQRQAERRAELYRNLIRREAKIGGEIFGPVPPDRHREFFCLDPHTWVWHEEWTAPDGQWQARTTRYDVRPDGILKAQDGQAYQRVTPQEALTLYKAAKVYQQRVRNELYSAVA
ncbi:hypothetical protein HY218_02280 [Candidatus Saccharibacteria bacterium]|nr:hypothetical protein [Candidatus Saccharibacteria bacterium]